jgi:glycolate oxidase iron-sulfur subunit
MKDDGLSGAVPIPVLDIHELLAETGIPTQSPASGPARRITWHDPCHLKLGLGLAHTPREIIGGLSGVEYAEAAVSSCCGGAGIFSLSHYELALKIGLSRAEELTATGARTIVTGCPGCRMQLEDMLARLGSEAVVLHTVELLDSVGEIQPAYNGQQQTAEA